MRMLFSITTAAPLLAGGAVALWVASPAHADQPFLLPNSLVISSSTYDRTQGAVASLTPGVTQLANTKSATVAAIADNTYPNVWGNDAVDASFGVTSAIRLTDIEPHSGHVFHSVLVPTDQVVTSFPSKSELGLHITGKGHAAHLVLIGYGSPGVGAIDVSNADSVAGQDPTNPVSFAFGVDHAFTRTIVSVDRDGNFAYTPTVNYGGNNGRAGLLGSNGLYYTVGNANNGDAAAFGTANNGTDPDVTVTTGLEVVTPIDAASASAAVPPANSAEVNPFLQYGLGKKGAPDKPGKDNNFRGVTEYNGALYFTKGSGSNGVQTVYTVVNPPQSPAGFVPAPNNSGPAAGNVLPTVGNAGQQAIVILNGFPTDSARASLADGTSGGDYTPFALFFANANTLYVTDEGTGNSADAAHAGLEKWILSNGTWTLAYTLTSGLIGKVDGNLVGYDGQYPDVTTVGLRNLAGRVNADGTVTLWATTSTSSASGDNGADPNKVVQITDQLGATSLTGSVAGETFTTVAGPTYATVYRGVAFVSN
jgi:hypothetical protein